MICIPVEEHEIVTGPVIEGIILEVAPEAEAYFRCFDGYYQLDVVKTSSFQDVILQLPIEAELEQDKDYSLSIDGISSNHTLLISIVGQNDVVMAQWAGRIGETFSPNADGYAKTVKIGFNQTGSFIIRDWSIDEEENSTPFIPVGASGSVKKDSGCFLSVF